MRRILQNHNGKSLVLLLGTVALFFQCSQFGFVNYDDGQYVYENPYVYGGISWAGVVWAFTTLTGGVSYWHPLTWLSHQLDCQLFGVRPGAHHLTNIWIHAVNVLLLFQILELLFRNTRFSWFVAGVFAVHPLHVESVAWIAERKDVLYSAFWLLALFGYIHHRLQRGRKWYVASILLYVLSLMSKPTAVTLPLVLIVFECFVAGDKTGKLRYRETFSCRQLLMRVSPYWALLPISGATTFLGQLKIGAVQDFAQISALDRIVNVVLSYANYIGDTVYPRNLCAIYLREPTKNWMMFVVALLILLAISITTYRHRNVNPVPWFGWCWFLVTLLPNIGLIQAGPQSRADRYMYIPLVGLLLMTLPAFTEVRWKYKFSWLVDRASLFLVLAFAILSIHQVRYWKNGLTLFSRAIEMDSRNWVAQLGLASALTEANRQEEALDL